MRISDWSSDVCSSDLREFHLPLRQNALRIRSDAAVLDQPEGFRCHRRQARLIAGPKVPELALGEVDENLISLFDVLVDIGQRDDRKAEIDAVARKQAAKARRNDRADPSLAH